MNKLPGNVFGTVTKIRPIIIITFGTTNDVVHNGITFGAGIDVSTVIGVQNLVLHLGPCKDSITNRSENQTKEPDQRNKPDNKTRRPWLEDQTKSENQFEPEVEARETDQKSSGNCAFDKKKLHIDKLYMHKLESVQENKTHKTL